jgi:UDPglucose--hexose-1-phosphate uridylyltransferase
MPEIRKEITKGLWTIVAPTRGDRPFDFSSEAGNKSEKEVDPDCPFCPGNESDTPEEITAIRTEEEGDSSWKVRVFPNKFPALDPEGSSAVIEGDVFKSIGGLGYHEVIAETPRHDRELADLSVKEIELVIRTYLDRFRRLSDKPEIKYVSIFKNHGRRAGASLKHSHSQIMGTTFLPNTFKQEYGLAEEYLNEAGSCLYCDVIRAEKREAERIVLENEDFIVICPYGSRFPYETRILPKKHSNVFRNLSDEEINGLSSALKETLTTLTRKLGTFPYNFTIHTAPANASISGSETGESYHWHLEIMPRVTTPAGFERGTNNFINIVSPEKAAKELSQRVP